MNTCEICENKKGDKVSALELDTWEFDLKEKKDFHYICFECFDEQTNKQIEKDTDQETRKQRSILFEQLVKEGMPCPSCEKPLTFGHICES